MDAKIKKWALGLSVLALAANAAALYMVFFYAPVEVQMGAVQKIFYYHVPSAISAYLMVFVSFAASIAFLAKRSRTADLWANAGAEVGLVFILCVLVTGPIWGRSAWGKWWVWEPRLTTFLVLFLMYVSYILIRLFGREDSRTAKTAAILSIIAFLDVPLVNRAIAWWGSIVHPRKVTLEPEMKQTFIVSFAAVVLTASALLLWRVFIGSRSGGEGGDGDV